MQKCKLKKPFIKFKNLMNQNDKKYIKTSTNF